MSLTDILDNINIIKPILHKLTMRIINKDNMKEGIILSYDAYKMITSIYYIYFLFWVHIFSFLGGVLYLTISVLSNTDIRFELLFFGDAVVLIFSLGYVLWKYKDDIYVKNEKIKITDTKIITLEQSISILIVIPGQFIIGTFLEEANKIEFMQGAEFEIIIYIIIAFIILVLYYEIAKSIVNHFANSLYNKINSYEHYELKCVLEINGSVENIEQNENKTIVLKDKKIYIKEHDKELFNTTGIEIKGNTKLIVRKIGETEDKEITEANIDQYSSK